MLVGRLEEVGGCVGGFLVRVVLILFGVSLILPSVVVLFGVVGGCYCVHVRY